MYIPKHFQQSDWQSALDLAKQASFAQLITVDQQKALQVSYLPVLFDSQAQVFIFHLARGNDHCDLLLNETSTVIFNGPHSYISPTWAEGIIVPTWNYTTVHIQGRAQEVTEASGKLELMSKMVDFYESASPGSEPEQEPWRVSDLTAAQQKGMFKAIRCFTLSVDHWEAKFKLSQNRSLEAVEQLANQLHDIASNTAPAVNEVALAKLMLSEYPKEL